MEATCSRRKRKAEAQIFKRWRLLLVERRLRLLEIEEHGVYTAMHS